MHGHMYTSVHVCSCTCGGQRTTLGVVPQVSFILVLKTLSLQAEVYRAGWPVSRNAWPFVSVWGNQNQGLVLAGLAFGGQVISLAPFYLSYATVLVSMCLVVQQALPDFTVFLDLYSRVKPQSECDRHRAQGPLRALCRVTVGDGSISDFTNTGAEAMTTLGGRAHLLPVR